MFMVAVQVITFPSDNLLFRLIHRPRIIFALHYTNSHLRMETERKRLICGPEITLSTSRRMLHQHSQQRVHKLVLKTATNYNWNTKSFLIEIYIPRSVAVPRMRKYVWLHYVWNSGILCAMCKGIIWGEFEFIISCLPFHFGCVCLFVFFVYCD